MTLHPKITPLAAALTAAAAFAAGPAWPQTTTPGTGAATSTTTTAPGLGANTPGAMGNDNTISSGTGPTPSDNQYDSSNTHLRADCYNPLTGTYRTTGECAALVGSGAAAGSLNGSPGTAAGTLGSGTPGSSSLNPSRTPGSPGSLNSSSSLGTPGTSSSLGGTGSTGTGTGLSGQRGSG